ncbi:hypothetical protein [Methanobrevibacter sp.]|uniref:hypothetical protein n=1 Tax=Methanobrevibacter sp. TaxID=66852 RepID=UPI00389081E1
MTKILFAIAILLIVFAGFLTFTHHTSHEDVEILDNYTEILGKNSNGTVYKITCGNNSSTDTVCVILGVHSLESGIHNATNQTIMNFTEHNDLSKRYVVYFIKLNFKDSGMNTSDYNTNRHMGEMLANKYVVPDIDNEDPFVVVDVHEMENYWDELRYIGVLDNRSDVEREYASRIADNLDYPIFTINAGTSPEWVTDPIDEKGYHTLLFETAQDDKQSQKMQTAEKLVRTIDALTVYK